MKKTPLLNSMLSELIASLGHQDMLVVADAGLPIPLETLRIDLALTRNIPRCLDTLQVILQEMQVDRYILAEETALISPDFHQAVQTLMGDIPYQTVSHARLKEFTLQARGVVRTGEFTPYANIILVAGVVF
jgi:D-ribose pyranase